MKNSTVIIIITTVTIVVVGLALMLTLMNTQKPLASEVIEVEVNGNIANAIFSKKSTPVVAGEIVSVSTDGVLMAFGNFDRKMIDFSRTVSFTVPGSDEKLFLGTCEKTLIEVKESGEIKFSLDYPQNKLPIFGDKIAAYKINRKSGIPEATGTGKNARHLASIIIHRGEMHYNVCSPRRVERLKGVLGMMFPDIEASTEEERLNLYNLIHSTPQKKIDWRKAPQASPQKKNPQTKAPGFAGGI